MNIMFLTTKQGHTFNLKVSFGTTIDQLLKYYLRRMNRAELIGNDYKINFFFNADRLKFGGKTLVEEFFKYSSILKIVVNLVNDQSQYHNWPNWTKEQEDLIKKEEDKIYSNNCLLNNEINNLKYELFIKDNEIKYLKFKIQNNVISRPKYDINDIMVVIFLSQDFLVNEAIKCLSKDIFAEVEEKLYKRYDILRNTNNMFEANAKPVLRFKKLYENGIKDGDKILLIKLE